MPEPILETRNLFYEYANRTMALRDVSLTIPVGKKTVVLGANGSGKSTLFLHFNGVLKPKRGEVFYAGKKVEYDARSLAQLRESVSVVLQNPDDQIFATTVEEDVAFGPMNLGLPKEEVERRVDEAMFLVDLEEVRERPTQQLSFGQRKRVALAGALAMKPKVLMMDEPTAGLDPRMVHELLELADELNQQGLTVIISTHDVETAYEWADEVRVLHAGQMVFAGLPEDFFVDEMKVHSLGLISPTIFDMNLRLRNVRGDDKKPYPHTIEQMIQKIFRKTSRVGNVRLITVKANPEKHPHDISAPPVNGLGAKVGVYGTVSRRLAHDNKIPIDYTFNSLENCIKEASQGRDFVMFVDEPLIPLVQAKLREMEGEFGFRIPIQVV